MEIDPNKVEINYRNNDGIEVFLYWHRDIDALSIMLRDNKVDPPYVSEYGIPSEAATEAFNHPFVWDPGVKDGIAA